MNHLLFYAARGAHRYTFDASLTYLALVGGVASLLFGVALVLLRRAAEPRRWGVAGAALGLLAASLAVSLWGAEDAETFADAFPTALACDLSAVLLGGFGSVAVLLRARSIVAPALLLPAWLLAQCGVAHARQLQDALPQIGDLETRPVHVGRTRRVYPPAYPAL